ncbi:PREDICTED: cingulin-like isoform X1 [Acropora digitifera]|uniref:cingulin-like isoform X1 n=1 Tax=Acropora digitifera TaxID=70779 RepID=UPI00077AD904|nr:PREDICTED: cingulin-like isoform X1 [Acropora digitifera]XP_015756432.1 PREDICTED: cingulin-like isoform X1 [Acropora digitifera]XP_015756494.1 PREDICTED: cingulin-like isoform X1 [Acropora digitifera]XP_015756564.1 PREDICTED: cingulin-like isoform X1 [Acropora digitifera]
MDADVSLHSADSICSDDTEYLLGQNVSIREIDDDDLQINSSHNQSPQHSPQKLHVQRVNLRSPSRKVSVKPVNEFQRSPGKRAAVDESPIVKATVKSEKKFKFPHEHLLNEVPNPRHPQQVKGQVVARKKSMKYSQEFDRVSKSKSSVKGSHSKQHQIQSFSISDNPKVAGIDTQVHGHGKANRSPSTKPELDYDLTAQEMPASKENNRVKRRPMPSGRLPVQQTLTANHDNWELDSEISLDMYNAGQSNVGVETNDLESEMSEATEDLVREEDDADDDEDIREKLKELNLAVNFDAGTNEYFDDKVREGAELLSKLFGGQVDNYYNSSRKPLWIFQNSSGQSKSSVSGSGSVQEVSRSDGHIEERRNLSNPSSSISQQTFQKSLSPQLQPRTSGQNSGTDQSSSFESSVSTSVKWPRSASRKEVRFREEMVKARERQQRNHHEAVCEFIMDTSALRAAMNYDDGVDDDNSRGNSRGQREYYQADIGVDELVYGQTRPQTSQSVAQIGKNASDCIKMQSPSKQRAPGRDENYSTHKDRSDQKYHIEQTFSDGGNSRRFDNQERESVNGGFMTSTPYTNSQAVFTPPKGSQVDKLNLQREAHQKILLKLQESEIKLNKSLQQCKNVEFELEEAMSQKKIALQEIHVLEETIKRNEAEVKSSENLVEQYQQQATKTRTQLMDLELQRDNIQHEIKELKNCLARQKQEAQQVVEVEKKNELKVLELSIEKDQLQSEMELLRSQLKQVEGNWVNEKQNYQHKIGVLQDQLHEEQKGAKDCVEKLKQVGLSIAGKFDCRTGK